MVSANAFHSTNLFSFSHTPTDSVAPLATYKPTHNPQCLQLLWQRANARNVSFFTLYNGQFVFNSVVNTKLPGFSKDSFVAEYTKCIWKQILAAGVLMEMFELCLIGTILFQLNATLS